MTNAFRGEFTVTLDGKEYKGLLNLNAMYLATKANNLGLEEFDKFLSEDQIGGICQLAYHSIKNYAIRYGVKSELPSFETFCAIVLDDIEILTSLTEQVTEALMPEKGEEGND